MSEDKQPIPDVSPSIPDGKDAAPSGPSEPVEKEIDLNLLFPDSETDLNALFPDADIKHLLKSVTRNKKDLHALKERFLQENETEDDSEEGLENQEAE